MTTTEFGRLQTEALVKRSKAVTLLTIGLGSLALAACDKPSDCNSVNKDSPACQQSTTSGTHGGAGYVYAGRPLSGGSSIASSSEGAATPSTVTSAEASTARGGFGATGEAASSSGHGGGEGGGGHGSGGGHGGGGGE